MTMGYLQVLKVLAISRAGQGHSYEGPVIRQVDYIRVARHNSPRESVASGQGASEGTPSGHLSENGNVEL